VQALLSPEIFTGALRPDTCYVEKLAQVHDESMYSLALIGCCPNFHIFTMSHIGCVERSFSLLGLTPEFPNYCYYQP
jgi:hypothetical protein